MPTAGDQLAELLAWARQNSKQESELALGEDNDDDEDNPHELYHVGASDAYDEMEAKLEAMIEANNASTHEAGSRCS
jgi:hypothetical protein